LAERPNLIPEDLKELTVSLDSFCDLMTQQLMALWINHGRPLRTCDV
jgi:hypothetical protein